MSNTQIDTTLFETDSYELLVDDMVKSKRWASLIKFLPSGDRREVLAKAAPELLNEDEYKGKFNIRIVDEKNYWRYKQTAKRKGNTFDWSFTVKSGQRYYFGFNYPNQETNK